MEGKEVKYEIGHFPFPEFKKINSSASKISNSLGQSLIDARHITSIAYIADTSKSDKWHGDFSDKLETSMTILNQLKVSD